MQRRHFIRLTTLAGLGTALSAPTCQSALNTDILILGGGIAGLSLAFQLQQSGREFILLEGSPRLGGRLYYHNAWQRDVGGRGIGDKYTEVMKLVDELKVELIDITDHVGDSSAIYQNGQLYASWGDRTTNPAFLEFSRLRGTEGLSSLDEWYQRPELDIAYSDYLRSIGHTDEELAQINISTNHNTVHTTSALNSLHSRAFRQFNGTTRLFNFAEGTGAFISALTQQLTMPVYTDKLVVSVQDEGQKVTVRCEDGSRYRAKKVISTLPFSTLREVQIDAAVNESQLRAIKELTYTNITQIHLQATEAYWEEDETPVSMWTDTPLERIMKINPDPEKAAELVCWVNGKGTTYFDQMTDSEIAEYTLAKMAEMRPACAGKLEYIGTHKWGQYPFSKGAYAEFAVGQAAWFEDMIQPAGNLHFAGEHTARESRGIEGAAESASRVFKELTENKDS